MSCRICGKPIPSYTVGDFFPSQCMGHNDPDRTYQPPVPIYQPHLKPCDHCYCKKSEDKGHKICCNCGNRQKISDMEISIQKFTQ